MSRKTTPTYVLLNQITLAAASSSVTFANLPQGYGDLVIVSDFAGSSGGANYLSLRFNLDSGSNYTRVSAYGFTTTSTGSDASTNTEAYAIGIARPSWKSASVTQIIDYGATDKHKAVLSRYGISDMSEVGMSAYRWANTAAITNIQVFMTAGITLSSGSTFSLYGIVA
jgi:hypothetical protein